MIKINADDMRETWLNPPELTDPSEPEKEFPPFKPREVKERLLFWWQIDKCATWIIREMAKSDNGWFACMTQSTVERWKRVILAHDRRLTGGKVLSELGELL